MGFDYIDFDSTLFDTTPLLFGDRKKANEFNKLDKNEKIKYIANCDWNFVLHNSPVINDGIKYLKEMSVRNTKILTKVHSLDNEGAEKIILLRELEVKNEIILVPFNLKKTDVVSPLGNRLIDDSVRNLDYWNQLEGESIFFNKDNEDIDEWGCINTKYPKIKCLNKLVR